MIINSQIILSGIAFIVIVSCVVVRTAVLRRRGIRAMVFGETNKSDFILVAILAAILYAATARSLGLPMWGLLLKPFWQSAVPGWVGVAFCALAVITFILTLVSFGTSFRVGIDEKEPAKLVTGGMFAFSRNPLYLGMLFLLTGLFLIHRNLLIVAAAAFFAVMIHRQILREEAFLREQYGAEYADYCRKVRRYI